MNVRAARIAPPEAEVRLAPKADWSLIGRLVPYAKPHSFLFGATLAMVPLASGAALFQPLLIKRAIDAAIVEHSRDALLSTVWLFVIAIAAEFVARFAQTYAMQLGGQRVVAQLRRDTFSKIQRLHTSFFDRTPVGKVVTRVTNDSDALGELFASGAVMAVADIMLLVGIVCFMLWLDWRLSLVAFGALPPLALIVNVFRRYAREAFRAIRARIALLNAYVAEQVQGVAVVQAFGREAECAREYAEINDAYRRANHQAIRYDALLFSVVESVSAVTIALILWYAAVRLGGLPEASTGAWVGTVVAFYEYIQRFFVPIRDLSQKFTILQSSLAAAERIFGILDLEELDAPGNLPHPEAPATDSDVVMALRDVHFGYRPGQPVLRGIDLEVRRGEKVAVVGSTGAGKSTVLSLLLRLHDVDRGNVLVHGRDVRDHEPAELRKSFALVSQDVFLFSGTVLENVALGDSSPDRERAKRALQRVGAWELVASRADGLDSRVDERGTNFSAGERQLIAFARALYDAREVLVLDEATASIDSETEARLQRAIAELLEERTALIIAHRLSTIRSADRILVIHHGRVAEEGTHDELVAAGGIYSRLHRLQFAAHSGSDSPQAPPMPYTS